MSYLIAAQCPHVTYVAGYRTWQDLGRQVGKGERTIKILGYSTKKVAGTDPDTGEAPSPGPAAYATQPAAHPPGQG